MPCSYIPRPSLLPLMPPHHSTSIPITPHLSPPPPSPKVSPSAPSPHTHPPSLHSHPLTPPPLTQAHVTPYQGCRVWVLPPAAVWVLQPSQRYLPSQITPCPGGQDSHFEGKVVRASAEARLSTSPTSTSIWEGRGRKGSPVPGWGAAVPTEKGIWPDWDQQRQSLHVPLPQSGALLGEQHLPRAPQCLLPPHPGAPVLCLPCHRGLCCSRGAQPGRELTAEYISSQDHGDAPR